MGKACITVFDSCENSAGHVYAFTSFKILTVSTDNCRGQKRKEQRVPCVLDTALNINKHSTVCGKSSP